MLSFTRLCPGLRSLAALQPFETLFRLNAGGVSGRATGSTHARSAAYRAAVKPQLAAFMLANPTLTAAVNVRNVTSSCTGPMWGRKPSRVWASTNTRLGTQRYQDRFQLESCEIQQ